MSEVNRNVKCPPRACQPDTNLVNCFAEFVNLERLPRLWIFRTSCCPTLPKIISIRDSRAYSVNNHSRVVDERFDVMVRWSMNSATMDLKTMPELQLYRWFRQPLHSTQLKFNPSVALNRFRRSLRSLWVNLVTFLPFFLHCWKGMEWTKSKRVRILFFH